MGAHPIAAALANGSQAATLAIYAILDKEDLNSCTPLSKFYFVANSEVIFNK